MSRRLACEIAPTYSRSWIHYCTVEMSPASLKVETTCTFLSYSIEATTLLLMWVASLVFTTEINFPADGYNKAGDGYSTFRTFFAPSLWQVARVWSFQGVLWRKGGALLCTVDLVMPGLGG